MIFTLSPAPKTDASARPRVLAATGLGALCGIQSWRVAALAFGIALPWYGWTLIVLGDTLMGYVVGVNSGSGRAWSRGLLLGLAFSLPSVVEAEALGLRWMPYAAALVIGTIVSAVLIAVIAGALPRVEAPLEEVRHEPADSSENLDPELRLYMRAQIAQRLVQGKECLERLDKQRKSRGGRNFGKNLEDRIVWGELIDLELQEIDEEIRRICHDVGKGPDSRTPNHTTQGAGDEHNNS